MNVCAPCVFRACEARRGRQIPLLLELLIMISCGVGAGNPTLALNH